MKNKTISIFGGSGFIGTYIVKELVETGAYIKILSRYPEKAKHLTVAGDIGQISLQKFDVNDFTSIETGLQNSNVVINLVGTLYGSERELNYTHVIFPKIIAGLAKQLGIEQLIHFSALGVKKAYDSIYACSKYEGEKTLFKEFPDVTIIKPSVVFGAEDKFINKIAKITESIPIIPLLNEGKTRFQPIYVGDLAKVVTKIIVANKEEYKGVAFEVAGNQVYSFKKIIELLEKIFDRTIIGVNIPYYLYLVFAILCKIIPNSPITVDQVKLLKYNNTLDKNSVWNLNKLGISPKSLEEILEKNMLQ